MPYTIDTRLGEILADTNSVKILDKHAPGVSNNPMLGLAEDRVKKVLAEINALKK